MDGEGALDHGANFGWPAPGSSQDPTSSARNSFRISEGEWYGVTKSIEGIIPAPGGARDALRVAGAEWPWQRSVERGRAAMPREESKKRSGGAAPRQTSARDGDADGAWPSRLEEVRLDAERRMRVRTPPIVAWFRLGGVTFVLIVLGAIVSGARQLGQIEGSLAALGERVDRLESSVDSRFDRLERRIDARFQEIEQRLFRIEDILLELVGSLRSGAASADGVSGEEARPVPSSPQPSPDESRRSRSEP